jgi:hypothetical protein
MGASSLPATIGPSIDHHCSECGASDWSEEVLGEECTVFLIGGLALVRFAERNCRSKGCNGRNTVDGIELGVLRRSAKLAFSHELLWDWSHRVSTAGESWFSHWRAAVERCSVSEQQKAVWMFRCLSQYQEACLDFVQLQRIDFNAAFRCSCKGGVTADGITLGFHLDQMRLVSMLQASSDEAEAEVVRGSLFSERIFVRTAAFRYAIVLKQICNLRKAVSDLLCITSQQCCLRIIGCRPVNPFTPDCVFFIFMSQNRVAT